MPARLDIGRVERARLRDRCDIDIANDPKLLRRGERSSGDETIDSVDRHSDESSYLLKDHSLAIEPDAANHVLAGQDKRRADVWVARKRHLGARRENADASGVCRIVRRQNKRSLGKIELVGDGLHLGVRKTARIRNHRQGVAAKLAIGEHIRPSETGLS